MKWTIAMTQEELHRKTIVERAIDKRITQKEGAEILQISERHFRRIIASYRQKGDLGLVSGHRGKPGNRKLAEGTRELIVDFIKDPLHKGFGPTFMNEKLEEFKGIKISKETMRQIMIEEDVHEARVRSEKTHPPRERKKQIGDIVQIDGSYHAWLEDRGERGGFETHPFYCLWMMPPVPFWLVNLPKRKVFLPMENSVSRIFVLKAYQKVFIQTDLGSSR